MAWIIKLLVVLGIAVALLYALLTILFKLDLPEWAITLIYGSVLVLGAVVVDRIRASRAG